MPVLRGRVPRVPATYDGECRFGRGQRRYRSLRTVPRQPYGVTDTIGCTNDAWLLASPDFDHATQRVRRPGTGREVMGDHRPRGRHLETRALERRGC